MLRVAGILLKTVDDSNLLLVLSVLVVLLPYGVCFSCFALKAGSPVIQISLKLTVAQVGAELEILLPQPPKCWDCRSGPSQLAYWVFASLPGWDLEQSSLFSSFTPCSKPLVSGCKLWPPPQSWPGCQACSPHRAHRIFFKSVSQPPSQPSPLPRSHPPRAPWCALGQGWSFTRKARQTLLIHALMPLYPVTLRPARVSRTSLKASVSQESYNKI